MQAFQWDARDRSRACRHAPYMSYALDLSHTQHLKPHDDESQDSDDDSVFVAFAEELDSNWNDLIAYDRAHATRGARGAMAPQFLAK